MDALTSDAILIRPNTIAVIVRHPNPSSDAEGMGLHVTLSFRSGIGTPEICLGYEAKEFTCPLKATLSIYIGADPGMFKNPKYYVGNGTMDYVEEFTLRDSVTSVYPTNLDCSYCLIYGAFPDDEDHMLAIFERQMITSQNYLWKFDDPNEFRSTLNTWISPNGFDYADWEFKVDFISLEGVQVNITGRVDLLKSPQCLLLPRIIYSTSFEVMPEQTLSFVGYCMQIGWFPKVPYGERFGFSALITAKRANTTKKDCKINFDLTKDEPQVFINPTNYYTQFLGMKQICVFQDCPSKGDCPLIIDVAAFCSRTEWEECGNPTSWHVLEMNNEYPQMTNCISWESPLNLTLFQCRLILSDEVLFREPGYRYDLLLDVIISVKALQWTNNASDFFLLPDPGDDQYSMSFPAQQESTWLSMGRTIKCGQYLVSLPQSHSRKSCEYRFYTGPPDYNNLHPERYLTTFRDDDRYIEQYFESELYSVLIPPGCSPSIGFMERPLTCPLLEDNKVLVYESQQEICEGVAIITSHGYHNPFEIVYRLVQYYVSRTITCPSYKVNVTVEIIDVKMGTLTINAYDEDKTQIEMDCAVESFPRNCTYPLISSINITWIPTDHKMQEGKGCFLRVYVSKSHILFNWSANQSTQDQIHAHSSQSIKIFKRSLVFLLCLSAQMSLAGIA